ncbi:hypothetical protein [Streptomyces sp. SID1328]|nr:hypothetical protein [Streptomyces sp. SID1328]
MEEDQQYRDALHQWAHEKHEYVYLGLMSSENPHDYSENPDTDADDADDE